jgi:UDP-4-amino-4,6-dideoxy-N-acetyl-beta-L-altrosamine transaminase
MINYGKQSIDQEDINAVKSVLEGDWLTQGPCVETFENSLKSYFKSDYVCVVSNGTAALHLAGLALGWSKNDIVITSPLTFLATANAIVYCGATPDFVDIDPQTYTLDVNFLEKKIKSLTSQNKKVKAVIGIDYAGHPCDWANLSVLCNKYNIKLINDNCHALGSEINDDKGYAVKYADIVTQSYHPVKQITSGEGGSILTNDLNVIEKVKLLRSHGMQKTNMTSNDKNYPWYYEMNELGFNYRITDIQCALGNSQLKKLDIFIAKRRSIANMYDNAFKSLKNVKIPTVKKNVSHSYHLYPLLIDFKKTKFSKSEFFNKMKEKGITLQVHYIPVHLQPYYTSNYNFKYGDFPVAESFYDKEFSLPIYNDLDENQVNYVIDTIFSIFKI